MKSKYESFYLVLIVVKYFISIELYDDLLVIILIQSVCIYQHKIVTLFFVPYAIIRGLMNIHGNLNTSFSMNKKNEIKTLIELWEMCTIRKQFALLLTVLLLFTHRFNNDEVIGLWPLIRFRRFFSFGAFSRNWCSSQFSSIFFFFSFALM